LAAEVKAVNLKELTAKFSKMQQIFGLILSNGLRFAAHLGTFLRIKGSKCKLVDGQMSSKSQSLIEIR